MDRPTARYEELLAERTSLIELLGNFLGSIDYYHYTWRNPLVIFLSKLFRRQKDHSEMTSLRASAAFLVLPGLIVYLRKALKGQRGETVVCILRTFAAAEDIEELILERA